MKKCILLYEDDVEILFLCKLILGKQNYHIETRVVCDNVIDDVKQLKPDLIIMDLWIPEMGGENAIKLIKREEAFLHIPIIVFSANGEIEEIVQRTNATCFLKKPFEIKAMIQTVKEIMEK